MSTLLSYLPFQPGSSVLRDASVPVPLRPVPLQPGGRGATAPSSPASRPPPAIPAPVLAPALAPTRLALAPGEVVEAFGELMGEVMASIENVRRRYGLAPFGPIRLRVPTPKEMATELIDPKLTVAWVDLNRPHIINVNAGSEYVVNAVKKAELRHVFTHEALHSVGVGFARAVAELQAEGRLDGALDGMLLSDVLREGITDILAERLAGTESTAYAELRAAAREIVRRLGRGEMEAGWKIVEKAFFAADKTAVQQVAQTLETMHREHIRMLSERIALLPEPVLDAPVMPREQDYPRLAERYRLLQRMDRSLPEAADVRPAMEPWLDVVEAVLLERHGRDTTAQIGWDIHPQAQALIEQAAREAVAAAERARAALATLPPAPPAEADADTPLTEADLLRALYHLQLGRPPGPAAELLLFWNTPAELIVMLKDPAHRAELLDSLNNLSSLKRLDSTDKR